jgi:hypothetical protein
MAMEHVSNLAGFRSEYGEFFGQDGLRPVGERFVGLVVHLDQEAISAHGNGGARQRKNLVALARPMRRINKNGKMAAFLDSGHDGEI